MLTIISGTNRPNSKTKIVADHCFEYMSAQTSEEVRLLDLADIDLNFITETMYLENGQHPSIVKIQDQMILPANTWLIISPEYNGSFPGILKLFLDAISVRFYKKTFHSKKVALIGVASGRAGNLRGMDHLTGLLNYLGMHIMPNKLPLSSIISAIDNGSLNKETKQTLEKFLDELGLFKEDSVSKGVL